MPIYEFYIPWNPTMLLSAIANFLVSLGQIFNTGIWIFMIIFGIVFIVKIVGWLAG